MDTWVSKVRKGGGRGGEEERGWVAGGREIGRKREGGWCKGERQTVA